MSQLPSPASARLRVSLGPLLLALAFLALTIWSWRKWPDLLVDFGRELYTPWQITQGQVLYRDLAHPYGPLSPYLNAAWFRLFGVSFTTLIFCNLVILAALIAILYSTLARACNRLTAAAGALLMLAVFAFSQYGIVGNFNFIAPYCHQATHGLLLAAAMLYALDRFSATGRAVWAAGAGLCFGLGFLTKAEVWVAQLFAVVVWFLILVCTERPLSPRTKTALGLFSGLSALPLLGFFLYFVRLMPWDQAARAVVGAWVLLLARPVAQSEFYRQSLGLVGFRENLLGLGKMSAWMIAWIFSAALLDRRLKNRLAHYPVLAGLFLALILASDRLNWWDLPRCFLLTTLAALIAFALKFRSGWRDPALARRYASLLRWSALALGLLGKMLFHVRVYEYGFYLALPATLILVISLLWFIPLGLNRTPAGGKLFRDLSLLLLVFGAGYYLRSSQDYYGAKTLPIGTQGDLILGYNSADYPRDALAAAGLERIQRLVPAGANFVALPEGIMLNYLSRRPNPTPYLNFTPVETQFYGESQIIQSFAAARPDFFVLVHKNDQADYGVGLFGSDPRYGRQIMEWVNSRYEPIALIGAEPLRDDRFGIKILKRRSP